MSVVQADGASLEVITLKYRSAAEMLPLLQPFIAKEGVLQAADDKLIVRTTPANLADLHKLITELDRPLQRLLIEVKQLSGDTARDSSEAPSARAGKEGRDEIRVWRTDQRDDADRLQRVQVVEGHEAFIDVGRQIPISDFAVEQDRNGTQIEQKTRYVGATTGFYAIPHIHGDSVTIDISPYQTTAQETATPPSFNVQSLQTTVSGRLGEWIALGVSTTSTQATDDMTYSTSQRGEQDRRVVLRVTVITP